MCSHFDGMDYCGATHAHASIIKGKAIRSWQPGTPTKDLVTTRYLKNTLSVVVMEKYQSRKMKTTTFPVPFPIFLCNNIIYSDIPARDPLSTLPSASTASRRHPKDTSRGPARIVLLYAVRMGK